MDYLPTLSIFCDGSQTQKHSTRVLVKLLDFNRPRGGQRQVISLKPGTAVIAEPQVTGNENNLLRRYRPDFSSNAHRNSYWLGEGLDEDSLAATLRHKCLIRCRHCEKEVNLSEAQALIVVEVLLQTKTFRVRLTRLAGVSDKRA